LTLTYVVPKSIPMAMNLREVLLAPNDGIEELAAVCAAFGTEENKDFAFLTANGLPSNDIVACMKGILEMKLRYFQQCNGSVTV
jgi:hypothetical protein